eukprot:TRINITY_DN6367_c0_g1_i1.p1 TRINITY_DN6367_c0_g1~~TRINITY_DN6367_c0_g1_i1.p1  ORF type:complete len:62 (-),score=0.92 TRINITY_DN6367_c0_g1_i1:60-245(-)
MDCKTISKNRRTTLAAEGCWNVKVHDQEPVERDWVSIKEATPCPISLNCHQGQKITVGTVD